jgi:hypothetical protein
MRSTKSILIFITVFICLLLFSLPTVSSSALSAEPKPSTVDSLPVENQIEQAVLDAVGSSNNYIQGGIETNLQVTDIEISQDQQWATAWVVYYDPQIEAVLPTEPALSVVHLINDQWTAFLPSDPGWQEALLSVPDDLLSHEKGCGAMSQELKRSPSVPSSFPTGEPVIIAQCRSRCRLLYGALFLRFLFPRNYRLL